VTDGNTTDVRDGTTTDVTDGNTTDVTDGNTTDVPDGNRTDNNITVVNLPPVANAGVDQTVTEGDSVSFDGSGSSDSDGTITAYEWKNGATIVSTSVTFSSSDLSVGTHTISLIVTDDKNATSSDDVVITVNEAPPPPPPPPPPAQKTEKNVADGYLIKLASPAIAYCGEEEYNSSLTIGAKGKILFDGINLPNNCHIFVPSGATIDSNNNGILDATDKVLSFSMKGSSDGTFISPLTTLLLEKEANGEDVTEFKAMVKDFDPVTCASKIVNGNGLEKIKNQKLMVLMEVLKTAMKNPADANITDINLSSIVQSDADESIDSFNIDALSTAFSPDIQSLIYDKTNKIKNLIKTFASLDPAKIDINSFYINISDGGKDIEDAIRESLKVTILGDDNLLEAIGKSDANLTLIYYEFSAMNSGALTSMSKPIAKAGLDVTVLEGEDVNLSGLGSFDIDGTLVNYEWKEGDVTISSIALVHKNDFSVGEHHLILTVTDNDGNVDSDGVVVTVNVNSNIIHQIESILQENLDTNDIDDAEELQSVNSAFNDVIDSGTPDDIISNMNSRDDNGIAGQRLATLGTAALGRAVTVESDVARVNFTPSNAATYTLSLTRAGTTQPIQGNVIVQGGTDTGRFTNDGVNDVTFTPVDVTDATPVELVLITGINARTGDILTFTPKDKLGRVGTSSRITLRDNVEPTTVLQNSYGLGNNVNSLNIDDGIRVGIPILSITAGLLDNLDAMGASITDTLVIRDGTLLKELNEFNKAFNHDSNTETPNIKLTAVYDTTAYTTMVSKASRKIGVAFSEDVDLNEIRPVVTAISTRLSTWTNNNDVVRDDKGTVVNVDLIDFTTANVIALANDDHLGVIDFTGVVDNAGNAATSAANAKVVLSDKMPPFVTKASFDGTNVSVTFNEAVKLVDNATLTVDGITASYLSANSANYVVSADKKTLTIAVAEFTGLTRANFGLGSYAETAYGSDKREHATLAWTVGDVHANEWTNESAGVTPPIFAIADLIGDFKVTINNSGYKFVSDTVNVDQKVIWTFNHPLQTGTASDLVITPAGTTNVIAEMEAVIAGAANALTKADLTLSADKKTLTLVFRTTTDATVQFDGLRMKASSTKTLTSAVDTIQSETISANAN
jgi:hypothetical protein